jgi:hypothetical protein
MGTVYGRRVLSTSRKQNHGFFQPYICTHTARTHTSNLLRNQSLELRDERQILGARLALRVAVRGLGELLLKQRVFVCGGGERGGGFVLWEWGGDGRGRSEKRRDDGGVRVWVSGGGCEVG